MTDLQGATLDALDTLLIALEMKPLDGERFRAESEGDRFGRIFGGQLLAQAMCAASATVQGKDPHSVQAYFVEGGATGAPVELTVDRVRDGRSMSTRRVTISQSGRTLLVAMVSFHLNPLTPELAVPARAAGGPDELPLLQDWVADVPPPLRDSARSWVDTPPPLEMRIAEPPYFMGGSLAEGARSHWMRLPRDVGDDPVLHAALLAYASDYLLLDMAFRAHPAPVEAAALAGFSLDHTLWLHRPVRFDTWHLYTQELVALSGHRGLVRGSIHNAEGHLVATASQEVIVR